MQFVDWFCDIGFCDSQLYFHFVFLLVFFLFWLYCYFQNKKIILILPYLLFCFFEPFYNFLDKAIFIKWLGGSSSAFPNRLNILVSANDLRRYCYIGGGILLLLFTLKVAKKIQKKSYKIIYCSSVLLFYIINSYISYMNHLYR